MTLVECLYCEEQFEAGHGLNEADAYCSEKCQEADYDEMGRATCLECGDWKFRCGHDDGGATHE